MIYHRDTNIGLFVSRVLLEKYKYIQFWSICNDEST